MRLYPYLLIGLLFLSHGCMPFSGRGPEALLDRAIKSTLEADSQYFHGYTEVKSADQVLLREESALQLNAATTQANELAHRELARALYIPLNELATLADQIEASQEGMMTKLTITIPPNVAKEKINTYFLSQLHQIRERFIEESSKERSEKLESIVHDEQQKWNETIDTLETTLTHILWVDRNTNVINQLDVESTLRYMMEGGVVEETIHSTFRNEDFIDQAKTG